MALSLVGGGALPVATCLSWPSIFHGLQAGVDFGTCCCRCWFGLSFTKLPSQHVRVHQCVSLPKFVLKSCPRSLDEFPPSIFRGNFKVF